MDKGVDLGDIVAIKKRSIQEYQTRFDLYQTSEKFCYELIAKNIDALLARTNDRVPQNEYISKEHPCHEYKANATLAMKKLTQERAFTEKDIRFIRVFDSTAHEPVYTIIDGKKVYLRVNY